MKTRFPATLIAAAVVSPAAQAQSIAADAPELIGFATGVVDFSPAPAFDAEGASTPLAFSTPQAALGAPDLASLDTPPFAAGIVSLGDAPSGIAPGSITLSFDQAITNGPGADFAVFENGFNAFFNPDFVAAELGFVEISTDGNTFARFFNTSLNTLPDDSPDTPPLPTDLDAPFGIAFAALNPDNVSGLAGSARPDGSDPDDVRGNTFDLASLAADPLVASGEIDLDNIGFVRVVDIPGDGRALDSLGNPIFDAFAPGSAAGGFDLDAIGVINQVPEPTTVAFVALSGLATLTRRRRA